MVRFFDSDRGRGAILKNSQRHRIHFALLDLEINIKIGYEFAIILVNVLNSFFSAFIPDCPKRYCLSETTGESVSDKIFSEIFVPVVARVLLPSADRSSEKQK
jgi:hypothetical protein